MIQNSEFLVERLAERDTREASQLDLEACYYERAYLFYAQLSNPALARIAYACGESINLCEG